MKELSEALEVFRYGYTPYGCGADINDWLTVAFNGESRDRLGFYHLGRGRRIYRFSLMRFLSPDSLSPFYKGGINAYAFCAGDPVNFSDPSGAMRRSTVKPEATGRILQKKVTWWIGGVDNPDNPTSALRNRTQGQASTKSILRARNIGPVDTKPPAAPVDYDVDMMTASELDHLRTGLEEIRQLRSTHKWNSEDYRKADAELRRLGRIAKIQKGIRQDRGLLDLTKEKYKYEPPGYPGAYPKEPPVDYD